MGRGRARRHGGRKGPGERFPDRRVPGDREGRYRHGRWVARLDLWRQPDGGRLRQRGARRHARTELLRAHAAPGPAAAEQARGADRRLSEIVRRIARLGAPARYPLPAGADGRRFRREAARRGAAVPDRGRQCAAHPAAARRRRARDRRRARHPAQGRQGMARVIRAVAPRSAIRGAALLGGRPKAGPPRHFLDIDQYETGDLHSIIDLGVAYKTGRHDRPLEGKMLAMIFEKPSTRTRVSFEVAMRQLGGDTIVIGAADSQLGRGETMADTARVLSRYVDAIMMRTNHAEKLADLARHATVPVINGLTDSSHPCQIMADVMTLQEKKGPVADTVVAWSGDGNNVAVSWVHAAVRFGFDLRLACPEALPPPSAVLDWAQREGGRVHLPREPDAAVAGADCVVTDTWVSMGVEANISRHNLLAPYRVDERLMAKAKPDAIFMHCLPAKRGEEVTAAVIDGPQSVVWDEAENRLHVQKGILAWCIG